MSCFIKWSVQILLELLNRANTFISFKTAFFLVAFW